RLDVPSADVSAAAEDEAEDAADEADVEPPALVAAVSLGAAAEPAPPQDPGEARAPVRLWVDAVLATAGGGQARVGGHVVQVGGEWRGADEDAPPVLLAVRGTAVDVGYRGERYALHLDGEPVVVAGAEPRPASAGWSWPWFGGGDR